METFLLTMFIRLHQYPVCNEPVGTPFIFTTRRDYGAPLSVSAEFPPFIHPTGR